MLNRVGMFAQPVNVTVGGLPAGATASVTPASVTLSGSSPAVSTIVRVTTPTSAPNLVVTGVSSDGTRIHSAPLTLVVQLGAPTPAQITSPSDGSDLFAAGSWTFQWNTGVGVEAYQLDLSANGSTWSTGETGSTSAVVPFATLPPALYADLPQSVVATLRSKIAGSWHQTQSAINRLKPMIVAEPVEDPYPGGNEGPPCLIYNNNTSTRCAYFVQNGIGRNITDCWFPDAGSGAQTDNGVHRDRVELPADNSTGFWIWFTAAPSARLGARNVTCSYKSERINTWGAVAWRHRK